MWNVEFTDEFGQWWETLDPAPQDAIDSIVRVLEQIGPALGRPYVDTVKNSRHEHMKELRVQCHGQPYRILFAFDPRRTAILLLGGNKIANKRWYDQYVSKADRLYQQHLHELRQEGLL